MGSLDLSRWMRLTVFLTHLILQAVGMLMLLQKMEVKLCLMSFVIHHFVQSQWSVINDDDYDDGLLVLTGDYFKEDGRKRSTFHTRSFFTNVLFCKGIKQIFIKDLFLIRLLRNQNLLFIWGFSEEWMGKKWKTRNKVE